MMSEYSIDQENSKIDSFYTINDSEFDNQVNEKKSGNPKSQSARLKSKINKYSRIVNKAHSDFLSGGTLFEDNTFPAINASLFENTQEMKMVIEEVKHISWSRPENIHSEAIFLELKSRIGNW
jgi:hypothetical protein